LPRPTTVKALAGIRITRASFEGARPVTIAIQRPDPIAAAEAEIAGSKSLMAAVADDLSQHERWLAHYQLAEKRHARWVMLQELIYRTELALRRLMRFLRRVSLLTFRLARRVASFTARTAVFVYASIRDAVIACIDWLRPRAVAFARLSRRWLVASWVWLAAQSRAGAALIARWSSAAWSWIAASSQALAAALLLWLVRTGRRGKALARIIGRNSLYAGSVAWAWMRLHAAIAWAWIAKSSRALAAALLLWLVRTGRRGRALARIIGRNSLYAGSVASAWAATTAREVGVTLRQNFSAASKWTAVTARILARASADNARRASAWGAAHSRVAATSMKRNVASGAAWSAAAARATAENARRASIWGAAHSRAAASSIGRNVSSGAAWSAATAKEAAHASIAASRESYSWVMLRMRAVSNATFGATAPSNAHAGRALIVRQSTALICFEPKRPGFPSPRPS
jgi:hypothetical protein